ncbi:MAG TPA: diaminopimelate decarboxylase, partial [Dehalococcoidales bacterium]|nr:diaminopimelate decarboxylase [Dehalococcoidales bacterium]
MTYMAKNALNPRLEVFPQTAKINKEGHLEVGGCDMAALSKEYGTPLYVFDEADLRVRCREYLTEFGGRYPDVTIAYSPKAFTAKATIKLVMEEGLDL